MNERQSAAMGSEARLLLENPAFANALATMREAARQKWMEAPMRDTEGQRLILVSAKTIDKFEACLRGMIENGKLAQAHIDMDDLRDENGIRRAVRRMTR